MASRRHPSARGTSLPPSPATVRSVVLGTVAVSLFHFTDNTVNVDTYPKASWQPDWFAVVVAVAWFVYTAVGVAGFRLYGRGRFGAAHACLLIYGYLVLGSLGHFLAGPPGDLTTRGLVSVFVDAAAGSAVIAVTMWSMARHRVLPTSATPTDAAPTV